MPVTSPSHTFTYDVFLNFRGKDTRHGFIGYLHKALHDSGIYAFIDDEDLQSGEEITPNLKEAIEKSRIAITVLSENYASSSFCLNELSYILHCHGSNSLVVLPVFYKVSPSDVRHQNGTYREALARHGERFPDNVENWMEALNQVGSLSGLEYGAHGYEHEFIKKIVQRVSSEIKHGAAKIHVADYPVGLGSQVSEIRKLLNVGSDDDVHMIGIYGMGGVGKSTLAREVYNLITDNFDRSCFLENVREESNKHGLKHLQSILLSQLLREKVIILASEQQGTSMIQNRLKQKKVLLILDDVDEHKQLQGIVGRPEWFGPGSTIIITTRDKQLLASHGVKRTCEVKGMKENDALQFLTWKAFKTEDEVDRIYKEVLSQVVTYASGLPLALEVIGSNLSGKSIKEWKSAIKQYGRIPNNQILQILKVSFDALGEEEKSVFLDIACCLKGCKCAELEDRLRVLYGHCMKYHIGVLVEKSLIKISDGRVVLHDLVEDMGKAIDRQKSPKEPGRRRRLWIPKDIIQVLREGTGTSEIEIINGNFPISDEEEKIEWKEIAFKEMINLKIVILRNGNFSELFNHLPSTVKVAVWHARES